MTVITGAPAQGTGAIDQVVGRSLRGLRHQLGLDASTMASLVGVTASDLTDYEEARKRAPAVFLLKVCQQLHVSPETFYRDAPHVAPSGDRLQPAEISRSWAG